MRTSPKGVVEGDFIRDPDHWPMWPKLPMKMQALSPARERRVGYLLDNSGGLDGPLPEPVRVYHGNIFEQWTPETPFTEYPTVDDLLGAGWEVD